MDYLIGIIILVAWILAIISIVGASKPAGWKLVWILIVLLLPLLGTILYFLIGKKS